jgi:hypothetical protein
MERMETICMTNNCHAVVELMETSINLFAVAMFLGMLFWHTLAEADEYPKPTQYPKHYGCN